MKRHFIKVNLLLTLLLGFASCKLDKDKGNTDKSDTTTVELPAVVAVDFNADSAYTFVEKQVGFGPRVPGSKGHERCAQYLFTKLKSYCTTAQIQLGKARLYNQKVVDVKNIIGSFNPQAPNRILLCAHWDTRPFADQESDPSLHNTPIPGANDGGSGTGVLLEVARQLALQNTQLGIDIVLFDVEDYGDPAFNNDYVPDSYCLGAQYWSKNLHVANYKADFGILLDMVGASNAIFTIEGTSNKYAPKVAEYVWQVASKIGHGKYFSFRNTSEIIDDHKYINEIAGIPTIDIIQYADQTPSHFSPTWHTLRDDMSYIDKNTLFAVGQTVITAAVNHK